MIDNEKHFLRFRYIIIGIVYILLLGMTGLTGNEEQQRIFHISIIILAIVPLFIPLLKIELCRESYQFINWFCFSKWGYFVKLLNKKSIYISLYDFSFSKYRSFLIGIKRIACFYNLAINMNYEDADVIDNVIIESLCDSIIDLYNRDLYRDGMIIPILICNCLSENKQQQVLNEKSIKQMIRILQVNKTEQKKSIQISLCILRDIYGNDNLFQIQACEDKLNKVFV